MPIDKDEPLFEISTDKVDAEIPSPGAGVLLEIKVKEGETVPVNSVVAVIGAAGEKPARPVRQARSGRGVDSAAGSVLSADGSARSPTTPAERAAAATAAPGAPARRCAGPSPRRSTIFAGTRSSPVVRKIAKEHGIDITAAERHRHFRPRDEEGHHGVHRERRSRAAAAPAHAGARADRAAAAGVQAGRERAHREDGHHAQEDRRAHGDERAHVAARVLGVRSGLRPASTSCGRQKKAEYEAAGTKLTYTAFIAKATVDTIRQFPFSNASIDGENIVYKRDINLGIAVALESGPDRAGDPQRRRAEPARAVPRDSGSGASRADEAAEAGRSAGRHVHDHQPRHLRRGVRPADHQPAAGRDSRRRQRRQARGRRRRHDRRPADVLPHARLRPPADRRRRRRAVPAGAEGAAAGLRRSRGCRPRGPAALGPRSPRRSPSGGWAASSTPRPRAAEAARRRAARRRASATRCCCSSIRRSSRSASRTRGKSDQHRRFAGRRSRARASPCSRPAAAAT